VALFTPRALARKVPRTPETWRCVATRDRVEIQKLDWFERRRLVFPRAQFEVEVSSPRRPSDVGFRHEGSGDGGGDHLALGDRRDGAC
jgi:hypothetical protein